MNTMTLLPLQNDYLSKTEFREFKVENGYRFDTLDDKVDSLEIRFGSIENKFDRLEGKVDRLEIKFDLLGKKVDDMKHDISTQNKIDMALWREKIQHDFKVSSEILDGKWQAAEKRLNDKLDTKLSQSYFIEYMEGFKKSFLKV